MASGDPSSRPPAARPLLAISTAGRSGEAEELARALVDEGLAACVNVVPSVRSFYRWQGAVQSDPELLLLIKTTTERLEALRRRLRELHSYDLPELIAIELEHGDRDYLEWVLAETGGRARE